MRELVACSAGARLLLLRPGLSFGPEESLQTDGIWRPAHDLELESLAETLLSVTKLGDGTSGWALIARVD